MTTFKDLKGREWTIDINVYTIKRVREAMNFDIQSLQFGGEDGNDLKPLASLLSDKVKLTAVIYYLCEDQIKAAQLVEEDFERAMGGEPLEEAGKAFAQAFFDFGQKRMRVLGRKIIEKANDIDAELLKAGSEIIQRLNPAAEAQKLIASSGVSRAS